tara:strand:- start:1717 stop:3180 length:1464 start_codon:yes stop_codon:yes gene_type:complete
MYTFDLPSHHRSIIKVIGVGGGGSNAVNYMHSLGIKDVEFIVCNTDIQSLHSSSVKNKLQIGINLTEGLGAGADPEKGKNAARESSHEIREILKNDTKMLFITAGMGGGTGTGAAPIIAKLAKELDILTIGIVTIPFLFEGKEKMDVANEGIKFLKEDCDSVIVIMNEKLSEIYGNLTQRDAFSKADDVLCTAARSIAEIITSTGNINVDFEDVNTVMRNAGAAVIGSATASGENRANRAAEMAINSPLLNNHEIYGAKKILLNIVSGEDDEINMNELKNITEYIENSVGNDSKIIFGTSIDQSLGEKIKVTVIASGFNNLSKNSKSDNKVDDEKVSDSQINIFEKNIHNSEVKSYSFGKPSSKNDFVQKEDQKIIFGIEDDYNEIDEYEKMEVENTNDKSLDYQEELIDDDSSDNMYEKYKNEREERIKKYDSSNKIHNELKESENKLIPAFKRKKVNLIDDNIENVSENTETLEIENDIEISDED